jgi:hypothetical protein
MRGKIRAGYVAARQVVEKRICHCEERSDEAIQLDCDGAQARLAITARERTPDVLFTP